MLLPAVAQASARVQIPSAPQGIVSDYAGVLGATERAAIEAQLVRYEQSGPGASQIAVVILPSLNGEPLEDVSIHFAERWKIGSKRDDGVLLLASVADRELRIEVGYGAEGRLTDALSFRIIHEIITPRLRSRDYAGGLAAGVAAIHQGLAGQAVTGVDKEAGTGPAPGQQRPDEDERGWGLGGSLVLLFLFFLLLLFIARSRGGSWGFVAGVLFRSLLGGRGGGGGSGGGFSGGGGSFGGGGASGKY
jgi:uncharacterized protein